MTSSQCRVRHLRPIGPQTDYATDLGIDLEDDFIRY
jgi:hypothetical protein